MELVNLAVRPREREKESKTYISNFVSSDWIEFKSKFGSRVSFTLIRHEREMCSRLTIPFRNLSLGEVVKSALVFSPSSLRTSNWPLSNSSTAKSWRKSSWGNNRWGSVFRRQHLLPISSLFLSSKKLIERRMSTNFSSGQEELQDFLRIRLNRIISGESCTFETSPNQSTNPESATD